MILKNINEAKQFLPSLNLTLENNRFNDFFRRAQEWLASHIIGENIESELETEIQLTAEDTHADLRRLCQRVIAEKALLDAIPEMDLQLTEAGFAVQQNDQFVPASSARVDRFLAKLPVRLKYDIDFTVRFLLERSVSNGNYSEWRGSEQFKYLTSCFMPCWEEYNRMAWPTESDSERYYALIEPMSREMVKVADYYVSREEVERLVELFRDNDLLEIHRKAIGELKVVAVAAYNGDMRRARQAAAAAKDVMMSDPDSFPAFMASNAYNTPSVNLDGGKMVNFL